MPNHCCFCFFQTGFNIILIMYFIKFISYLIASYYFFVAHPAGEFAPVEPPALEDPGRVELNEYYAFSRQYPWYGFAVRFRPDHFCEIKRDSIIGQWRVSNDTLFIYEDYFCPGDTLYLGWASRSRFYDAEISDRYRNFFDTGWSNEEFGYPANVGVFKIENYGMSLSGVDEYKSFFDGALIPAERWRNWRSGGLNIPTRVVELPRSGSEFEVCDKTELDGSVSLVSLLHDGVLYRVVNPAKYMLGHPPSLYEPKDEKAMSAWMNKVKVGRSYKFELVSPAYPDNSTCPYLQCCPDSVCVWIGKEQNEAVGYFFAKRK